MGKHTGLQKQGADWAPLNPPAPFPPRFLLTKATGSSMLLQLYYPTSQTRSLFFFFFFFGGGGNTPSSANQLIHRAHTPSSSWLRNIHTALDPPAAAAPGGPTFLLQASASKSITTGLCKLLWYVTQRITVQGGHRLGRLKPGRGASTIQLIVSGKSPRFTEI